MRGPHPRVTLPLVANAPRILIVSSEAEESQQLIASLRRAGATPGHVPDIERLAAALTVAAPALVIARADPESPEVERLERALRADPSRGFTPIALITERVELSPVLQQLRSGIVAIWQPAPPAAIVQRAFTLLAELPRRTGVALAGTTFPERALLWRCLRETRRTGALRLGPERSGDGTALLVDGALREAVCGALTGAEAVKAILNDLREPLHFREVSGFPGCGASVVLQIDEPADELPLLAADELEEVSLTPPPSARTALLLVDDDLELCRMFGVLFRKHGFEVTVAHDGLEGFEKARGDRFDVVVADLNMPRMDGWGLLRLLREDAATRELPVAFLSCHDNYRDSLKALNSGAQAYFSKSIRLEALAGQVRAMVQPRERFRQALARGTPTAVPLDELGVQTCLRTAATERVTGLLEARDEFASYELVFSEGRPRHATAQAGRHHAQGERAFVAFVAARTSAGHFTPGPSFVPPSLEGSLEENLARALTTVNLNERQAQDATLLSASGVEVDPQLYEVYAQVGPQEWLETARLICEEKLAPREVIARVDRSPIEVEETIRDLLRRGVVRFRREG